MALIWGPILASQGTSALLQEYQFITNSGTGIAEVVGKTRVGQKDFYVDCRLLSGVGATVYEKRLSVYSGLWQNLRKGQTINVDYLRTDPANMRLQGSIGNLGDSLAHLVLGSLLIVIAIMASIGGVECLAKEAARRANGQAPERFR